ncbi:hypothetical protein ABAC402_17100 [Asticcacaulis sp. AC402]|nr:hypothetical protein ABAC402_17100 [Asticcacaulis sp. AC402]
MVIVHPEQIAQLAILDQAGMALTGDHVVIEDHPLAVAIGHQGHLVTCGRQCDLIGVG